MQRFQFNPERVLAIRRMQCEHERAAWVRALAERAAVAEREQLKRAERTASEESLAHALHLDAYQVTTLRDWQARMKITLTQMAGELRKADERVAAQQVRLQEAELRVKLLERLRERRMSAWQTEADREIENFAAEAYLARCIRLKRDEQRARSSGG